MHARKLHLRRTNAPLLLAVVGLFVVGIAGCATKLTPRPGSPSAEAAPYVGVFTGEFVDGNPLYRFPTIEVVGTRNRAAPGT
jgi:hypothetical protein